MTSPKRCGSGCVLFSALWLTATVLLIKPNGAEVSSHDERVARAEAATTARSA
jgi:hypothetical protein